MPSLRPIINELQFLRAVARFFVMGGGGTIAIVEGMRLVGSVGVSSPQKILNFQSGGSETLFSALVIRYVSEKSTSNMKIANNCKTL